MQSLQQRYNGERPTRYGRMMFNLLDAYVGRSFQLYGEFSEGEVELFRRIVKPGQRVLDIGANIGAHTIPLAQLVGLEGEVLAFEPQRQLYYILCGNVALNSLPNVWTYPLGVGATDRPLKMPRWSYAAPNNFGGMGLGDWPDGLPVAVMTLDSMKLEKVDLLKVDVEGMEREVLEGARELIARTQPVIYLENDRQQKSEALIKHVVLDLNYSAFWHTPPLYNADNYDRNPVNVFQNIVSLNMLCLPPGKAPGMYALNVVEDLPDVTPGNLDVIEVKLPSKLVLA